MDAKNRKRARGVSVAACAVLSVAFLMLGVGTAQAQYCPDTGTCSNREIPAVNSNPYQLWANTSPKAQGQKRGVKSVLLYDRAPAYEPARAGLRRSMSRLSQQYGFRLVLNDTPGYITDSTLAGHDIVVFAYGEGDVLDGATSTSTQALERFIYAQGNALLMIHTAAAYIRCPTSGGTQLDHPDCHMLARAAVRQYLMGMPNVSARVYADSVYAGQVPPHGSLGAPKNLGPEPPAAVIHHGIRNEETRGIFANFPRNNQIPRVWEPMTDRWLSYISSPRPVGNMTRNVQGVDYLEQRVNVLLSVDELSVNFGSQRMGDRPVSWTRKLGKGLAAVSIPGDNANVYTAQDSVLQKYHWNLLRYLARDFVGCTCSGFTEFNPEATVSQLTDVDVSLQCGTRVIGVEEGCPVSLLPGAARSVLSFDVHARSGGLRITVPARGRYAVNVLDLQGREVATAVAQGGGQGVDLAVPGGGLYLVRVTAPDGSVATRRVVVD